MCCPNSAPCRADHRRVQSIVPTRSAPVERTVVASAKPAVSCPTPAPFRKDLRQMKIPREPP
uniref:Uncharacterized protein n=1 Tax=Anopheles atroparvus TaxID=41427 RepID=A0AAG5CT87_ANOAO